jgi:hypothetical protein
MYIHAWNFFRGEFNIYIFDVKTYDIVLRNVESTEGGSEAATPVISL